MLWCYKYSGGNKTGQICSMCIIGYSCWISTANFSSFSSKIPSSCRIVYMVCDEVFIINLNSNWCPTARLSGDLWFSVVSAFPRAFPMEMDREMTKLTAKIWYCILNMCTYTMVSYLNSGNYRHTCRIW